MLKYFLVGIFFYLILAFVKITFVFFVAKTFRTPFRESISFNVKGIFLEVFLFGGGFVLLFFLKELYADVPYLFLVFSALFIALVPTYRFLIKPVQYLFYDKVYTSDVELDNLVENLDLPYKIRLVKKKEVNAYATGVLPFTKTILIMEPMLKILNKKELISIVYHEVGHLRKNHLQKLYIINLFFSIILMLIFFFTQDVFESNELLSALKVFIIGSLVGLFFWYFSGKIQYKMELEADSFSAQKNGSTNLVSALKKMDIYTKGSVSKGGVSYPTLEKRIHNVL